MTDLDLDAIEARAQRNPPNWLTVGDVYDLIDEVRLLRGQLAKADSRLSLIREYHAPDEHGCCGECATGPWDYNPVESPCATLLAATKDGK